MKKSKKCKKAKRGLLWDQKKCLDDMLTRYGTQSNWVEANVHMTYHEVVEYYGPQCEEFESLCACCRAWLQWNQNGTVPVTMERNEVLKVLGIKD